MPEIIDYAQEYLQKGFSIIPTKKGEKKPCIPWADYQQRHPTDAEINQWFSNGNNPGLAIITGKISGIVVLDFDTEQGYKKYEGILPKTPTTKTARGFHSYFKFHEGVQTQRRENMDVKSNGGYVVAPPSVHPSGVQYHWVEGRGLDDIPIADIPDEFLRESEAAKPTMRELYMGVSEGNRNDSLARLCGSWVRDGLSLMECLEIATAWNEKNAPPLEGSEVERTVRSIFERHHEKNGDHEELIKKYGNAYYLNAQGKVSALNEGFWAGLHAKKHIEIYEPNERAFYRYEQNTGLYKEITPDAIKQEISQQILEMSREKHLPTLEGKRTNIILNNITGQLRGFCEKRNAFRKDIKFIHLANGVILFNESGEMHFTSFSPEFYSRNQSPIRYDENAKCPRFLKELLYPTVGQDDVILIQKYMGLCLLRNNLIQRFLIFDGEAGMGKSTLSAIFQKIVGVENVTQLRTPQLSERFELYRFIKKSLLVGIDVPANFLSMNGAHVLKGLVGGDYFDAEQKGGTGSFPV